MYTLAVIALLGLALFKVVDVLEDLVPGMARYHALITLVIGVAAAVAFDYSAFAGWKVAFRDHWMGIWATGFAMAGATSVWRAMFHWLGTNEGDAPEERHHGRLGRPHIAA